MTEYGSFCNTKNTQIILNTRKLREETGVQRSLTERLVRSRLQWAGHVERMADDRLPKRAAVL